MGDRTLSAYTAPTVQEKLSSIYYTPKGYFAAVANFLITASPRQ